MTDEEIRVRLYAAQGDMSAVAADCMLNSTDPLERYSTVAANARADRLLAAHLEITNPLREAADELAEALELVLAGLDTVADCPCDQCKNAKLAEAALTRYRNMKDATS